MREKAAGLVLLTAGLCASGAGCGLVLGLGDFTDTTTGGGGATGSGATGGATTTDTASSSTGAATGGGGAGGGSACRDGEKLPCYDGPPGTEGKGACVAGKKTCLSDGTGFGECVGDVTPESADDCVNNVDASCDGMLMCACTPDTKIACYDGQPPDSINHPPCKGGERTCKSDGTGYGPCEGQVVPAATDTCGSPEDENCDGVVDDLCTCTPADTQTCYEGTPATNGVGKCKPGTETCNGTGTAWGPCLGQVLPGTEDCNLAGDEDCNGASCSDALWSRIFTSPQKEDYPIPESVAIDSVGNVFVGGTTVAGGPFDLGSGLTGAWSWVVKLDNNGVSQWVKELGPNVQTLSFFVTSDFGNVYVAGSFGGTINIDGTVLTSAGGSDIFVASWNASGVKRFAVRAGGTNSEDVQAVRWQNGNLLVGGSFSGSFAFSGGSTLTAVFGADAFVAKLDTTTGAHIWSKAFGDVTGQGGNSQVIRSLAVDAAGNALVAGEFTASVQIGAGGTNSLLSAGQQDVFVAKLAGNNGSTTWCHGYGGPAFEYMGGIGVDSTGAAVVTGSIEGAVSFGGGLLPFSGSGDVFAVKLSSAGAHVWSKSFGAAGFDGGQSVAVDVADNVILAGAAAPGITFGGMTFASGGVYLAKLDSTGAHLWSKSFTSTGGAYNAYVATPPVAGHIAYTFTNQGAVDVGNGPLDSGGTDSVVVGAFNP